MKNNIAAAFAATVLIMTVCVEENLRNNDSEAMVKRAYVSSSDMSDPEKQERYMEFYDSIPLECNTPLADETGGIMKLSGRVPEKNITYADSMTKELVEIIKGAENYRILYADTDVKMETAVKGKKMKISICSPQSVSLMIFDGSVVNSFFPLERECDLFTLSEEDMASYSSDSLLDSTLYYPDDDSEAVRINTVSVNGEDYLCEVFNGFAYIFDDSGTIAMFCDSESNFTARIETGDVSDSVFSFPDWYTDNIKP